MTHMLRTPSSSTAAELVLNAAWLGIRRRLDYHPARPATLATETGRYS